MRVKRCLTAWLLSFCISFGSVAGLVTAFDLQWVDLPELGHLCFILCGICAWCFICKPGPWIALGLAVAYLGYLWRLDRLWDSARALAYRLSVCFHAGYGWKTLSFPAWIQHTTSSQIALQALMVIPALMVCWTVCRPKRLIFTLPIALIPLYPCLALTDLVPDNWCLLLVLFGIGTLVLTQSLRRLNPKSGSRITAFVLVPAMLTSWLLVYRLPRDGYWSQFENLSAKLSQYFPTAQQGPGGTVSVPGMPSGDQVDLSNVGPQVNSKRTVMEVKSSFNGTLYLRYQAFDRYSGTGWSVAQLQEAPLYWPDESELKLQGRIQITTRQKLDGLFVPYYPHNGSYHQLEKGKLPNSQGLTQYSYAVAQLRSDLSLNGSASLSRWLALPQDTREAADRILLENGLETPRQILDYVQSSALYDLETQKMPAGETDFAIWFLENSDTGYCVHFATAATVLLRAAGYHARYVTGYTVQVTNGETVKVMEDMAHAWVEYLDPEEALFWQVLEPTPGFAPETPSDEPTTEPEQTTAPTESTEAPEPTVQAPGTTTGPAPSVTEPDPTPSGGTNTPGSEKTDLDFLLPWLRCGALLAAAVLAVWLQRLIRLRLRLKRQRTGHRNAQALARWREICRLSRLLKTEPPEALLELAEKARFSQHTLTREELFSLGQYLQLQRRALDAIPAWKKLFLRLIWAV